MFAKIRPLVICLAFLFVHSGWAYEGQDSFNDLSDQFKSAQHGVRLNSSDLEGEWSCEFHFADRPNEFATLSADRAETYNLTLIKKLARKSRGEVVASDDILNLEAELVSHHNKAKNKVEMRVGPRRILSGKASAPFLDEMAHDRDLDTIDEIGISHNGAQKTLIIERSYFYKGPYQAFSLDNQDVQEWQRRHSGNIISSLRVPRAYSLCVKAI